MSPAPPLVRPEATTWSIDDILHRAQEGLLRIPQFQRNFCWNAEDVRKLFDSLYRGYPIGDLLVWETDQAGGADATFASLSFPKSSERAFVIVDGQQRITSIVAVMLGHDDDPRFRLCFDLRKRNWRKLGRGGAAELWQLPLSKLADTVEFLEWLQARQLTPDEISAANSLVRSLRDYRVPVYVVQTREEQQIREIFDRLNTTGKRLKATEVFGALKGGRHADLARLAAEVQALGFGEIEERWLLKALGAVLGLDVTRQLGETLKKIEDATIRQAMKDTTEAVRAVVGFLREDAGVLHQQLLPYKSPLVPLTKLFHNYPNPSPTARRALVAWLWRGVASGQHQKADAQTLRRAVGRIRDSAETSAKSLLADAGGSQPPALGRHNFKAALTKLACCVLANLEPRHLGTGAPLDVPALLDEQGPKAMQHVVPAKVRGQRLLGSDGTENRLLHPGLSSKLRYAILDADPSVLAAHCVSNDAWVALDERRLEGFLAARRALLQEKADEFLSERMLPEADE